MNLPPLLPLHPLPELTGQIVALPGSKSVTNRALILAALSNQELTLRGALFSRDTEIMIAALESLGFSLSTDPGTKTIRIRGCGGAIPSATASINVGNAGTAARFLTAFLCLHPQGTYDIDGDTAMHRRPMRGLIDALTSQGASFSYRQTSHHLPFTLHSQGMTGGALCVDASESSQMLSALLMTAPLARHPATVHLDAAVRPSYIRMTIQMMRDFGQPSIEWSGNEPTLAIPHGHPYTLDGDTYAIEPDASAASYFLALPLVTGGCIQIPGLRQPSLQGDIAFAEVLEQFGLAIKRDDDGWTCCRSERFPVPATGREIDFSHFSDTFMTLAAISPLLPGKTTIHGIAHTRLQECDRIEAMADGLRRLGQAVTTGPDSITIEPNPDAMRRACANGPVSISTYEDHRIAMSFGILGCHRLFDDGRPWIAIEDPACCGKTFPSFFDELESLRTS